jgi:small-conductance mechanosensitive channel
MRTLLTCLLFSFLTWLTAQSADNRRPERDTLIDTLIAELPDTLALGEYTEAYYQLERLNEGLPDRPVTIALRTPQAALEHFVRSSRAGDYAAAAHALNLNLLPRRVQLDQAAILAEKLHYVINKRVSIGWDELPDRPDGQINLAGAGRESIAGKPQRSIQFGQLSLQDRPVALSLQRVRVGERAPAWVISASTVENIEPLYAEFGPTWLDRNVPDWADRRLLGISLWKVAGVLLLGLVCYLLFLLLRLIIRRLLNRSDNAWLTDLSAHIATPAALALAVFVFYIGMNDLLSIAGGWSPYLYAFLLVVVIGSLTWLVMRSIDYIMERLAETQVGDISDEENMESRRVLTTISVARRVITFIVIIVGIGVVAGQFPALQNLGVSLLASAGLATIIIGIAAQPTLGNIVAGLQIAITKPARIGDSVIFEGEYGTIEEVRFTYLVIKTWDDRRLIIPLKYFITNPFENWSMNDPHLIKPIILHADYKTDVDKVREKFSELLKGHELYDGESEPKVQVVDSDNKAMELRCLCSAKDASTAWTLHCDLREAMIAYLAGLQDGKRLPREREEVFERNG